MHVYFSGIGGAAIGPLALIAKEAGYEVSGSDSTASSSIDYLKKHGLTNITIGQTSEQIEKLHAASPIDWLVYSSALPKTNPDHPELVFASANGIKLSRRDEFLNVLIKDKKLKLVAIAGTHGKTTVTAMVIWLMQQLDIPVSYSVGGKIKFGEMGVFDPASKYFVYEADEYDRNFLSFFPYLSIISGLDYDHPDTYPSEASYNGAFREFIDQSGKTFMWHDDAERLGLAQDAKITILDDQLAAIDEQLELTGHVNRKNAWLVAEAIAHGLGSHTKSLLGDLNRFPGISRRFEQIVPNIYSDYAHTPPKIRGALQMAREVAANNVVVVYEGLHNTRQHFIKEDLEHLFDDVKKIYVVPSFLAREDPSLPLLQPSDLVNMLSNEAKTRAEPSRLDDKLLEKIKSHAKGGDLVLALSAGGPGSLDEWLRQELS